MGLSKDWLEKIKIGYGIAEMCLNDIRLINSATTNKICHIRLTQSEYGLPEPSQHSYEVRLNGAYGHGHVGKLVAEFECFARGRKLDLNDFIHAQQKANAGVKGLVDDFMRQQRQEVLNWRSNEGREKSPVRDPKSHLDMANLFFFLRDFQNCGENAWAAASKALKNYARKICSNASFPPSLTVRMDSQALLKQLDKQMESHSEMKELNCRLFGKLAHNIPILSLGWQKAENLHRNFYQNHLTAKWVQEDLEDVVAFVDAVELLAVDAAAMEKLADFMGLELARGEEK